jgi:hypothetical protein
MERQLPLADYARNIDLHPDILRQALTGHLKGADSHPLSALAKAINRDPEKVDLTILPCDESFGMWLKRNMEGITQHALRARAQLDSQTLKRFLNGDLLPDSDQAERISRALYIDRLEIARVVTANMAAASPSIASQEPAKTMTEKEVETRRSKRSTTRRLANVAAAEQTPAPTETKTAADDSPVAGFAAEDRKPTQASSRRRPRTIEAPATDIATSGDVPSSFAAEIAPSKPDQQSADNSTDRTVPLVTGELAADTMTLQLSADEVRLIRHWRQLHPHGRRATLQYIGSLLVDE